ncbi:MAG: type II secretion system protein [Chloroflexi bacterium]|nr:type II secretion system protein [Chloroflexota bacterium]
MEKRGFTLIELLVVIAVIALLMGILMPSLQKARKLGQSTVCKAHLRQWGTVFFMYTSDYDDKFWVEPNVWQTSVRQGGWMPWLASMYGNVDAFRLCPSADKINGTSGGIGTTFKQWVPGPIMVNHQFGDDASKNFGSYGLNAWICSVGPPSPTGWRNSAGRQWKKLQSRYATEIPMISDCTWYCANPISRNDKTENGNPWANGDSPPPTEDWWETQEPINFGQWSYDTARVCLNRHSKGVNMTFMDGSSRKVRLHDIWTLKWHGDSMPDYEVEIPWLGR